MRRRHFLGAALAGGAALAVPGCSSGSEAGTVASDGGERYLPFRGPHQTGVAALGQSSGLMAAFTVVADTKDDLRDLFRTLTTESERIMTGIPYEERDPAFPPPDTGSLGNPPPPGDLSVLVSVGSSLFDDRYGLADRRPVELEPMPYLANDRLDPDRTHGDLLLSIASGHTDFDIFALRQLMRATRGGLVLKWMVDGYNRGTSEKPDQHTVRNLMGFIDGTNNVDASDDELLDRHVWVAPTDGEPAWATGGSYHVVRVIRMLVEFWDRTSLTEQERLIGREKHSGDFPPGGRPPIDSHIRLANPRSPETADQVILRKGLNYSRGFDKAGQLDQGLAFVSFQRSLSKQFLPIAERLNGEGLEEYLRPEGGGFYYLLPGAAEGRYLGETLLT